MILSARTLTILFVYFCNLNRVTMCNIVACLYVTANNIRRGLD
jgi:hypothetical protein